MTRRAASPHVGYPRLGLIMRLLEEKGKNMVSVPLRCAHAVLDPQAARAM